VKKIKLLQLKEQFIEIQNNISIKGNFIEFDVICTCAWVPRIFLAQAKICFIKFFKNLKTYVIRTQP